MRLENFRLVFVVSMLLLLVGCKNVTIESPDSKQSYQASNLDFELSFSNGAPDDLQLSLNGADVTKLFAVNETGASASGSDLYEHLLDGVNTFKVVKPNESSVRFNVDKSGPEIHITSRSGNVITGYLQDVSDPVDLSINGSKVSLTGNYEFRANLPNTDIYRLVAKDSIGLSSAIEFADPRVEFDNSIGLRIEQAGIDFLMTELESLIVGNNLNDFVAGRSFTGTLLEDIPLIGSIDYLIDLNSVEVGEGTAINAGIIDNDQQGELTLSGVLPDMELDAEAYIVINGRSFLVLNGIISTDVEEFSTVAVTSVDAGAFDVQLSDMEIQLGEMEFELNTGGIGSIPGMEGSANSIVTSFANLFSEIIEPLLAEQLEIVLPPEVEKILDVIPSSIELDVLGKVIKPEMDPEILRSPARGFEIGLGSYIYAPEPEERAIGSLYKGAAELPTLTSVTPAGDTNHVGGVVSDNMVNQVLVAAFESGLLNLDIDQDSFNLDGDDKGDVIKSGDEIRLEVRPYSPPTLKFIKSDLALARFTMLDFAFDLFLKGKGQSKFVKVFGATVDFSVRADLNIEKGTVIVDGEEQQAELLKVGIEGLPVIEINEIDRTGLINWSEKFINDITNSLVPIVAPAIVDAIAIPMPSFEGYSVKVGDLWVINDDARYINYAVDLVRVSETVAAPAPTTLAKLETIASAMRSVGTLSQSAESNSAADNMTISLAGDNPEQEPLQYRYRIDDGPWSLWKNRDSISLKGLLPGSHQVEVCSRTSKLKEETDCPIVNVSN